MMGKTIISKNNNLYLINEDEFNPKHIFENGQAFRWFEKDGGYISIFRDRVIYSKKLNEEEILDLKNKKIIDEVCKDLVLIENGGSLEDYKNIWYDYFDMKTNYSQIRESFSEKDPFLREACKFGVGLRVLNQDLFEMVISFIISANNQIPNIKKSINKICEMAGKKIDNPYGDFYSFPSLDDLLKVSVEDLKEVARVGYRAEYIYQTIRSIKENYLDNLSDLSYLDAHKKLCGLSGIGPKVADCILLFGNRRYEAFPVDTWVKKFMNEYYLDNEINPNKIKRAGIEIFGPHAGLAQQYLFYYARENKVGK